MSPEHKPDPDDEAPTTKPKVTWKGIVDVPIDAPTGRKEKLMAQMSGIGSGSGSGHLFTRRRKWALAALAIIAVVGVVLMSSLHTVSAGTVAVPVTLGSAETPLDEGLHLTPPWPITDLNTMSVQTQNYTMTAADTKGTDAPSRPRTSTGSSVSTGRRPPSRRRCSTASTRTGRATCIAKWAPTST